VAGSGGELVPSGDQLKRGENFISTVERPNAVIAEASMPRLKLVDENLNGAVFAVDESKTIQVESSIEKMLGY